MNCTIIISHYNSLPFLKTCIRQIRKYSPGYPIIIADQSDPGIFLQICALFNNSEDITLINIKPLYSGYGIDYVMRHVDIKTEYICQLHVDAFPIHSNWLLLPIILLNEYDLSFVGQLQFFTKPTDTIYYLKNPFFAMAQAFNIARTDTYKEMSLEAGFTRFHARPESELKFNNDDWDQWAKEDYFNRGTDDDVVAFAWESNYRDTDKLGLAITGFIQPSFGRIIEDLVFHFGSCRESIGVFDSMPGLYREYTKRINEDYNDSLINEMISLANNNKPPETQILSRNFWDGKLKQVSSPSSELINRINQLKNVLD